MNEIYHLTAAGKDVSSPATAQSIRALPVGGILIPASPLSDFPLSEVASPSGGSFGATSGLRATSGALSFCRNELPYDRIANWTHSLPKTPTDTWMDVVDGAVRGPNHRWLRHHPVDFAQAWWGQGSNGSLKWGDYGRHCVFDSITTKGLPLFPEEVHTKLVSMGATKSAIFDWTHFNAFDVTVGSVAMADGAHTLLLAITGHLPWNGVETFIFTFGWGTVQIIGGVVTENPLIIAGGVLDIAAGATSYWHHIHIPELSLIETIVPGLLGGLAAGSVITATRMLISWQSTSPAERALIASESMGYSALMGTLAMISPWISLPLAVAYASGKFAFKIAKSSNEYWTNSPVSSSLTPELCRTAIMNAGGIDAVNSFEAYLKRQAPLGMNSELNGLLTAIPDWSSVPKNAAHVFGLRDTISW